MQSHFSYSRYVCVIQTVLPLLRANELEYLNLKNKGQIGGINLKPERAHTHTPSFLKDT